MAIERRYVGKANIRVVYAYRPALVVVGYLCEGADIVGNFARIKDAELLGEVR